MAFPASLRQCETLPSQFGHHFWVCSLVAGIPRRVGAWMRILLAFPLVSALLCAGPALAQAGAGRCYQLRAELDRLGRPVSVDETRIAQYQGAIDRQSDELQRTTEY